jgi:hypothetical protein
MGYPHLFFSSWPFNTVPDPGQPVVWADRSDLKRGVDKALHGMARTPGTSLLLLWADFGAGKTHTLRYLEQVCSASQPRILPVYCVLPRGLKSFFDLYREATNALDMRLVADMLFEACDGRLLEDALPALLPGVPQLGFALRAIRQGGARESSIARQWLRGSSDVSPLLLRTIGIDQRLRTTDDAIAIWTAICGIILGSGRYDRIVFMVDEFQRASLVSNKVRDDVNAGLHTVYNATPTGLTLLLSFSCGSFDQVRYLLSGELIDRAPVSQPLLIHEMGPEDAGLFIRDLLDAHRLGTPPSPVFPYTDEALDEIVRFLVESRSLVLKPRTIMQVMHEVTSEVDYSVETGEIEIADAAFVSSVLKGLNNGLEEGVE